MIEGLMYCSVALGIVYWYITICLIVDVRLGFLLITRLEYTMYVIHWESVA